MSHIRMLEGRLWQSWSKKVPALSLRSLKSHTQIGISKTWNKEPCLHYGFLCRARCVLCLENQRQPVFVSLGQYAFGLAAMYIKGVHTTEIRLSAEVNKLTSGFSKQMGQQQSTKNFIIILLYVQLGIQIVSTAHTSDMRVDPSLVLYLH